MSRHEIPARGPGVEVVVGWDNPLQTYFAQVRRRGRVALWVGGEHGELKRAEDLAGPLAPHADLTPEHVAALRADRAAALDRGPTALQRALPVRREPPKG